MSDQSRRTTRAPGAATTGLVYDELFEKHVLGLGHPETPLRLPAIRERLQRTGLLDRLLLLSARVESQDFILSIHTRRHYDSVLDCRTTGPVAKRAVDCVLGAMQSVCDGVVRNAFCAIRPPGHHAFADDTAHFDGRGQGRGFCFFNNVAIAARYAQSLGYRRILIADWDYHYGNGTANAFRADPSVLFFSTHNWHDYPGTGDPAYTGDGPGAGYTINVHLPPGASDEDIVMAWKTKLLPAAARFKPEFVLISAGFDSRQDDLLGTFDISDAGFAELTRMAIAIADEHCGGRIVSLLEGGYNVEGQAQAVAAHAATLAGLDWRQFSGATPEPAYAVESPIRAPEVRQGMLFLPEETAHAATAITVTDETGRPLFRVAPAKLGRMVVDVCEKELAPGRYRAVVEVKSRDPLIVPFEQEP